MPYICVARSDIPDGTVQVLDLQPNTSSANSILNPVGQTAYFNRAQNDAVSLQSDGTLVQPYADGIRAYLADRVEPGALETATGSITIASVAPADTITIAGVVFTCVAGVPNAANQEFRSTAGAGSDNASAITLSATINNAASVTLMKAANATNRYVHAAAAVGALVTLDPLVGAAAVQKGYLGDMTLASSSAVRTVLNTGASVTNRLYRTNELWSGTNLTATATALQARVDAGSAMALTDINTVLLAQCGGDLTGSTSPSRSTGSLTEFLSLLAGRGYRLSRNPAGSLTPNQVMTSAAPTHIWDITQRGSFTEAVTTYGNVMNQGEIRPVTIGGDTVQREFRPIRHIVASDSLSISLALGTLAAFTVQAGPPAAPPVTLWPDSGDGRGVPHFPWIMQPEVFYSGAQAQFDTVSNARVLTVYDDSGNVLS